MICLYIYFIAINLIAIIITYYDKVCAIKNKRRIKERTLFIVSALGGSLSMYLTMKTIRHKTKHKRFMIGIPCILILQIFIVYMVISYVS